MKREIRITYILAVFFFMLLSASFFYAGKLPVAVAAFRENIEEKKLSKQGFEVYKAMNDTFQFELPDSWDTNELFFEGGEIQYHMNFISHDKRIHGFVQVWKLSKPLKQFIEESEKSAAGIVDFKYYDVREIMVEGRQGYLLEYARANPKGEYNKAYEVFVGGKPDKMYRISFFVPEKEWRNYYKALFVRIVRSIRIKE